MLALFDAMKAWVVRHRPAVGVHTEYRNGPAGVSKGSAVVGLQTPEALGSVAVWGSGEVEAEVLLVETLNRSLVISATVASPSELTQTLDRVLSAMGEA